MFGRVIHGFEHIQTIGKLPTDGRDRPLSPVTIVHCGELELKRPPAPAAAARRRSASPVSASDSEDSAEERRRRKRKEKEERRRREYSDDSEDERRRRRKEKKRREREGSDKKARKPRDETEEELDARLEREEKERLEEERLAKLVEMRKQLEEERQRVKDAGGVVYKGMFSPFRNLSRFVLIGCKDAVQCGILTLRAHGDTSMCPTIIRARPTCGPAEVEENLARKTVQSAGREVWKLDRSLIEPVPALARRKRTDSTGIWMVWSIADGMEAGRTSWTDFLPGRAGEIWTIGGKTVWRLSRRARGTGMMLGERGAGAEVPVQ